MREATELQDAFGKGAVDQVRSMPGSDAIYGELLRPRTLGLKTTAAEMNKRADKGIEKVIQYGQRGVVRPGASSMGSSAMSTEYALQLGDTPIAVLYSLTQQLKKETTPAKTQINEFRKQIDDLKGDFAFVGKLNERTRQENYLRYAILEQEAFINERVQAIENVVSEKLGRRFRYAEFEAGDWKE